MALARLRASLRTQLPDYRIKVKQRQKCVERTGEQ
jgi:hypothetical protein